jgi:hypothetical protein
MKAYAHQEFNREDMLNLVHKPETLKTCKRFAASQ